MTGADFIAKRLFASGCSDFWGIPGGVILEFMYAVRRNGGRLHLSYHEQCAAYAAMGYAQATRRIGVAYVTRGPGFANALTALADAYFESIPLVIVTAHAHARQNAVGGLRCAYDQELDAVGLSRGITKFSACVDASQDLGTTLEKALEKATSGRRGPVVLDVAAAILKGDFDEQVPNAPLDAHDDHGVSDRNEIANRILDFLNAAERPVLLVGDGVKAAAAEDSLCKAVEKLRIPVVSSRGSLDLLPGSPCYFGYVGSHGVRAANFILSKADRVVALGNRMSFPLESSSFAPLFETKEWLRIDIDDAELARAIPGCDGILADIAEVMPLLAEGRSRFADFTRWMDACKTIAGRLAMCDVTPTAVELSDLLPEICSDAAWISSDVGNNEFLLSRALFRIGIKIHVSFSKSFGVLGSAIGRAIGLAHATREPVVCVVGDQGFQMNVQELQAIAAERLPVRILVVNNLSSAMIRDVEAMHGLCPVHVDGMSGYQAPDLERISGAYGIPYLKYRRGSRVELQRDAPVVIELPADATESLVPFLPKGHPIYDMSPALDGDCMNSLLAL